jgi:hypothetical protein
MIRFSPVDTVAWKESKGEMLLNTITAVAVGLRCRGPAGAAWMPCEVGGQTVLHLAVPNRVLPTTATATAQRTLPPCNSVDRLGR